MRNHGSLRGLLAIFAFTTCSGAIGAVVIMSQPRELSAQTRALAKQGEFIVSVPNVPDMQARMQSNSVLQKSLGALSGKHGFNKPSLAKISNGDFILDFRGLAPESGVSTTEAKKTPDTVSIRQMIASQLKIKPNEVIVTPNYIGRLAVSPNDPETISQTHLNLVEAMKGWDLQHDAASVVIAVLDSGIMLDHEDLKDNLWVNPTDLAGAAKAGCDQNADGKQGYDFYNCDDDPSPDFLLINRKLNEKTGLCESEPNALPLRIQELHGTRVAGVIGAVGNNAKGVTGLAWKVQILPVKVADGVCGIVDLASAIRGIDYAIRKRADIINASWGGFPDNKPLADAIKRARDAGILFVVAAGNNNEDLDKNPTYPEGYGFENMIVVASSDPNGGLSGFSNYGKKTVHIAAPGESIFSTSPIPFSQVLRNGYDYDKGTSFAAPIVSGIVALMLERYSKQMRKVKLPEIRQRILRNVTSLHDASKGIAGGLINVRQALASQEQPAALLSSGVGHKDFQIAFMEVEQQLRRLVAQDEMNSSNRRSAIIEAIRKAGLYGETIPDQVITDLSNQLEEIQSGTNRTANPTNQTVRSKYDAIIEFESTVTDTEAQRILSNHGASKVGTIRPNMFEVIVKDKEKMDATLRKIESEPGVKSATEKSVGRLQ